MFFNFVSSACPLSLHFIESMISSIANPGIHLKNSPLNNTQEYGEIRNAKEIGTFIIDKARTEEIETSEQLLRAITLSKAVIKRPEPKIVTKTFQALRIYVNNELLHLKTLLRGMSALTAQNGLCIVITFHSLETGIVDKFLLENSRNFKTLVRGLIPSEEEILANPASRSGKLFAFYKR